MTERKDFKRVVRTRARRTGETYSSALRNVRNASERASAPGDVNITRTIPDVRASNVDKTVRFYVEFLGFGVRREAGVVKSFVSRTDPDVEVTLNHGTFVLPEGFIVELETALQVATLFARVEAAGLRIVDRLGDAMEFSILDSSGHCVTVTSAQLRPRLPAEAGSSATITNALAGVTTNDLAAAWALYVDLFGFEVGWERDGMLQLRSRLSGKAELLVAAAGAPNSGDGRGFDLNVGTVERVEHLHETARGNWVVMYEPTTSEHMGIRGFSVLDPTSTPVHVYAPVN